MPLDMSAAAAYVQDQQQQQADSGSGKRRDIINYKYRPGQNRGRALPPWPGSGDLAMHIWHHTKCPLGGRPTHFFCWENMYPGRGIECPICTVCKQLRAKLGNDSGIWKQEAWDSPRTNWVDRQPLHPQTFQPLPLEMNPGPQIIDLDIHTFNYLMSTAVQTGCDLTSTEFGYDIIINHDPNAAKKKDSFQTAIVPGAAMPLAPSPELAKLWLDNMYDLRSIVKMPNWQDQKGKAEWEKICSSARELERTYLMGAGMVQGFSGQQVPVGQFPQQQQMPQFTQPSAGIPTAPPPQFAQPAMMGAPGTVPFGAPAPPAAPMFPSAPPMPPPPATAAPATVAPPPPLAAPLVSQAPPPGFPPPTMPFHASMPQVPQVDTRPPWIAPPAPTPMPPAPPVPMPQPPPTPPAPGPSMTNTSADGKPICFGHSRLDTAVEYGATGQAPVKGGFSEDPAEVGYRCMMCPQQLECSSKAQATFPEHYAKKDGAYVILKAVAA